MAEIIQIRRVEIGARTLKARVRLAEGAPLRTDEDKEGTSRVLDLLPHIVEHVCLGDVGKTFADVIASTEIAHLLEHVTVEILAQTNIAGDITCGRTSPVEDQPREWEIELDCPDDVLVASSLASAVWLMSWAYSGGGVPEPDVEATVSGLVSLVESLPDPIPQQVGPGEVLVDEFTPLPVIPKSAPENDSESQYAQTELPTTDVEANEEANTDVEEVDVSGTALISEVETEIEELDTEVVSIDEGEAVYESEAQELEPEIDVAQTVESGVVELDVTDVMDTGHELDPQSGTTTTEHDKEEPTDVTDTLKKEQKEESIPAPYTIR